MAVTMTEDLLDQTRRAIGMLRFTIAEFEEDEWLSGVSWFYTPARVAMHTALALEGYFFNRADGTYSPTLALDDAWWKLRDDQLPSQVELLAYLADVEGRIVELLSAQTDDGLSQPYNLADYSGKTVAGHYAYALRHTMHHQGALTVLATRHGHEGECWR
jgi:uncharacterized damage-inducible protein DinB